MLLFSRTELDDLRKLTRRVLADLRDWPARGPRLVDELECVCSVLLAITFAHMLEVRHVGWAAFSGYMVMRSDVWRTFKRGGLRVLGTAVGALSAWYISDFVGASLPLTALALLVVTFISIYFMMVSPRGYAWLFLGLTFGMVFVDAMASPAEPTSVFALTRFIEVCAGTAACLIVSLISTLTVRRHLLGQRGFSKDYEWWVDRLVLWHPAAFGHALHGAVAAALIPLVWYLTGFDALSQSAVTIMVVMCIPIASLMRDHTRTKLVHRVVGCSLGALMAGIAILVSAASPLMAGIAVALAVIVGRHIEKGGHGIDYVGTQFVLGFLTVMVPDSYDTLHIAPGFERLLGVFLGLLLLEPVRKLVRLPFLSQARAQGKASAAGSNKDGSGE